MPEDAIAVPTTHDGVDLVTIDDGKVNALSPQVVAELRQAVARAVERETALVITGRPGCLSAGFDLSVMKNFDTEDALELMRDGTLLYREMLRAPVPVVVACCGHALAAGALLLLADDVTVGLRGPFKIGLNEVAIGVPMPRFAMVMAEHRLPPHRRPVSVLGAQIGDTDQAYTNGFVDIVVDDDLLGRALGEAARLRDLDRTAFSVTKRRLNRALLEELDLLKGAGL